MKEKTENMNPFILIKESETGREQLLLNTETIGEYDDEGFKLSRDNVCSALWPVHKKGCPIELIKQVAKDLPDIVNTILTMKNSRRCVLELGRSYSIWIEAKEKNIQLSVLKQLSPDESQKLKDKAKYWTQTGEGDTIAGAFSAYKNSLH